MTEFRKFLQALLLHPGFPFACFLLVVPFAMGALDAFQATMLSLALGLIFGVPVAFGAWMDRNEPRE